MEDGLWGLFFALMTGMTTLALKQPSLYQRVSPLIRGTGIGLGLAILVYGMLLGSFFGSLRDVIAQAKMDEAIAIRDGWQLGWKFWGACFWLSIYAAICDWLSRYIERD